MQLERMVEFHKTVGDKTRIQIIALLKRGPLHGQALATKLALTPATISYHLTKLREIDIVYQRRDKNTIYFYLHEEKLKRLSEAMIQIGVDNQTEGSGLGPNEEQFIVQQFFDVTGKLKRFPKQSKKQKVVLAHLSKEIEMGRSYTEQEINDYIKGYYDDYATIRRGFIMYQLMYREQGKYTKNPPEIWT